jgi:hypothetical protein
MSDTAHAENAGRKQRGRPFTAGASGNPAGKPKGCRNRAAVLLDAINDDDLTAIVAKLVTRAKSGDMSATKILLDRLVPAPRARAVAAAVTSVAE